MINEEASRVLFDCMDIVFEELKKYTEYSARDVNTNFSTEYLHLNHKTLEKLNDFMLRKEMKDKYKQIRELTGLNENATITILKWSSIQLYFYQLIDFLDEQFVRNNIIFNCGVYTNRERTAIKMLPTLSSIVEHLESFDSTPDEVGMVLSSILQNWITPYMIDENNDGLRVNLKDSSLKYKYQLANNPEQIECLRESLRTILNKYNSLSKPERKLAYMQSASFNLFSFIEKDFRIRQDIINAGETSLGPSIYNSINAKRAIDNRNIFILNPNAKINIDDEKVWQDFKANVTYDKLYELDMLMQIVISKHVEPCIYSVEAIMNENNREIYDENYRHDEIMMAASGDMSIATKCSGLRSHLDKNNITSKKVFVYWQMFVLYRLGVKDYTEENMKDMFIINPQYTTDRKVKIIDGKKCIPKSSITPDNSEEGSNNNTEAVNRIDLSYIETDKDIVDRINSSKAVLTFGEMEEVSTSSKHSHHKEPVEHIRKEHLRHMKSGKVVKVRQSVVNKGNK